MNTYDLKLLQGERKDALIKYTGLPACHLEGNQTDVCFSTNSHISMNFDAIVAAVYTEAWESTLISGVCVALEFVKSAGQVR